MTTTKRWPLNKAYFWERAPFFRLLLPFAAGILLYDKGWVNLEGHILLIVTSTVLCIYALVAYRRKYNDTSKIVSFALLHILLLLAGNSCAWYNDIRNNSAWFGNKINTEAAYVARITDAPAEKEHSWKIPVTVCGVVNNNRVEPAAGKAFVYLYKDEKPVSLHKGDTLLLPAKWQAIKNAGNPFEFDYATYCKRNGLVYQQFIAAEDVHQYAAGDPQEASFTERMHDWCMLQFDKYIPDATTKGLIQAMILGDEVHLDNDLRQAYAETGIIHIIAISGGNVAIFFIIISMLLWWLRHKKYLWVRYAVALPLVWVYVIMAGSSPSAIRAAVMFSLLAVGIMFDKNNNSLNQLFATAFVLLVAQPMWLFSLGFQLSFVAVLSLILFYMPVYRWLAPVHKISKLLWGTVAASIAAELLVAPLVIYYFHLFPVLFIVANAAAYIFMSVVLVMGIAIIVLSLVPAVASLLGACVTWLVTVFGSIVGYLQHLNPQSFRFLLLTGVELLLVYLIIAGISSFLLRRKNLGVWLSLTAACVLLCSFCAGEWVRLHQQSITVFNTSGMNHIEVTRGVTYAMVNAAPESNKKALYAAAAAHAAWQAWEQDAGITGEVFLSGGRTVLVLNRDIETEDHFAADIVVINYKGYPDPEKLRSIYSPSLIVVGNNYSRKEQEQWIIACSRAHMPVHATTRDGAFVVQPGVFNF